MKRIKSLVALGALAAALVFGTVAAPPARAQAVVSMTVFYESLAPHGAWVQHPRYGYVWYPTSVDPGWRPYSRGRWVATEEHGWYWESDYKWGWATFHYGRWALDPEYGWVWIPGTEWGPAWVAWREGNGVVGWAPLPPGVDWRGGRLYWGNVDMASSAYLTYWSFVPHRHFLSARPYDNFIRTSDYRSYMARTRNYTTYRVVNRRVVNGGLTFGRAQVFTGQKFAVRRVNLVDRRGGARSGKNNSVNIYRPQVRLAPNARPQIRQNRPASPTRPRAKAVPNRDTPKKVDPRSTNPRPANPRLANPRSTNPGNDQSKSGQPKSEQPKTGQPKTGQPKTGQPNQGSTNNGQSGRVNPKSANPEAEQPRSTQPTSRPPRAVQTRPTGPANPNRAAPGKPAPRGTAPVRRDNQGKENRDNPNKQGNQGDPGNQDKNRNNGPR